MSSKKKIERLIKNSEKLFNNALSRAHNKINLSINSVQNKLNTLHLPNTLQLSGSSQLPSSPLQSSVNRTDENTGLGIVGEVGSRVFDEIKNLGSEAMKALDSLSKFEDAMKFSGFGTAEISKARTDVRKYANDSIYDLQSVIDTTALLATNGVKDYTSLAQAVGNLNALAGGSVETYKSAGDALAKINQAGKLSGEDWNQFVNDIPGASGRMQEALRKNGAFTGDFQTAMEKGKISANEFNKALMDLGNDPIAVEAAKSTKTFEGALGHLRANVVDSFMNIIEAIGIDNITNAILFLSDTIQSILEPIVWVFNEIRNGNPIVSMLATIIGGLTLGLIAASVAQSLLNVAMSLNPVSLIVGAVVALIAMITIAIYKYDEWGAALLQFLGPIGWVINAFIAIKDHWDSIVEAFKTEGIIGAFLRIEMVLRDSILKPLEQLLTMIAEYDPTGISSKALENLKAFRGHFKLVTNDEKQVKINSIIDNQQNTPGFMALSQKASLYKPKSAGVSTGSGRVNNSRGLNKTKDDINKVTGSANQVKKIDIKIDSFNKGGINVTNENGKGMSADDVEKWLKEMFQRIIIDAENV